MHQATRLLMRTSLWAAVLLVLAQMAHLLPWVLSNGSLCDYPVDCVTTAYPHAFRTAHLIWVLSTAAGLLVGCVAILSRSSLASFARVIAAGLVGLAAYLVSPFARSYDPQSWIDGTRPVQFGVTGWLAEALFLGTLVIYGWDVVRRLHALEAESRAVEDARRARSVGSAAG